MRQGEASTVCIGIAGADNTAALQQTLTFLARHTDPSVDVIQLVGAVGAAAFNGLVTGTDDDVVVLLENGALVGPRWLDLLLSALARPGCGLAGPSTNRAWNEQAAAPDTGADLASVRRDAANVLARFGPAVRSLAPLHSLGDFCFAVRREVVDEIGVADPAYGAGPCWEMDYNVRAARAGHAGVWVGGAWVRRAELSEQRLREEQALLEGNRHLYQDRFCGRRLRGESGDYRDHCRGDACADFAPRTLVQLTRRPGTPAALPAPTTRQPAPASARAATVSAPLVSCIMPTRGRPELAARAAQYFLAQDLTDSELVIIEDGPPGLAALLPRDLRIRLTSSGLTRSIGAMRNHACALAYGEVLVEWDDDDWHGGRRLTEQVTPLLAGTADITGLNDLNWLEVGEGRCWRLTEQLQRRMLARNVYGGTLAFHRRVWADLAHFPDRSLAEDAAFLDQAVRRGARLQPMTGRDIYVYIRHGANTWRVPCGDFIDRTGWLVAEPPSMPLQDREFYNSLGRPPSAPSGPLVTCVMPTAGRRRFVGQAIGYFLRQDYPNKELLVLDDGADSVADLMPEHPAIRYERSERRLLLGAKRNRGCELASGELIAHWDDDDWQSPHRLGIQVRELQQTRADVCGMGRLRFYDPVRGRAWLYSWPPARRRWAAGTSLMFSRDLWRGSPFPEVAQGEDTRFLWRPGVRSVADVSDSECVIALVHAANTVTKTGYGSYWTSSPVAEVERLLGDDLAFYRAADLTVTARGSPKSRVPT